MAECKSCKFWDKLPDSDHGLCRRHAPNLVWEMATEKVVATPPRPDGSQTFGVPDPSSRKKLGVWPTTSPDDWCGEFKPPSGSIPVTGGVGFYWACSNAECTFRSWTARDIAQPRGCPVCGSELRREQG